MLDQTDPVVTQRLREALASQDIVLQASLAKSRSDFNHAGNKGDAVESAVRQFLRAHLPRKFDIGTGEVIDRFGNRSPQADVIVLNDEQPFVHPPETNGVYLAEGVSAVGEVKAVMGSKELNDILDKAERVKAIRPSISVGSTVRGNPGDLARFVDKIPYFALVLETSVKFERIHELLTSERGQHLDALFMLDRGTLENFGDGSGSMQYIINGVSQPGWWPSTDGGALASLFVWLNSVMPRVTHGTSVATQYFMAVLTGSDDDPRPS